MKRFYKKYSLFAMLLLIPFLGAQAQNAWINEIHYDNASTDVNEFIEVVIENPGNYTLSLFEVYLYNGGDGATYGDLYNLSDFAVGATIGNFTIYHKVYPVNGLQNGSPDGLALTYNGAVISGQFLSYEGSFSATNGPANGTTSVDIGVSESSSTLVGYSLQLSGTGDQYSSFTWQGPADDTPGQLNNNQTLGAVVTPILTATPLALSGFNYTGAGPSASQSYTLSGSNLTPASGNIGVTGSTNYEVSTDDITFSASATLPYMTGTLGVTTIFVRLKAGLSSGDYNDEIIINSGGGATPVNVTCDGTVPFPEPTNHATNFLAGTPAATTIPLTWTDATGGTVPTGYLVKASLTGFNDITAPTDFVPEADGQLVKNVAAGVQTVTFTNLLPNQDFYFKIFPYTNSGAYIDYKTDGIVPQASATTLPLAFRSAASGIWNVPATWLITTDGGTNWVPSTLEIPEFWNCDVTIRTGHTVTFPTLPYTLAKALDLTVENGAVMASGYPTGTAFIYVYGNILNDGTIGGASDALGMDIEGPSCTIGGTGTFNITRMAKFTTFSTITNLLINQNVTLRYSSASNPALSNNNSATTTFNITIAPGKTLTVPNASINLDGCSLILDSDWGGTASLIDNGIIGTGAASVVVRRTIGGWSNDMDGWHLLSSPVASQTIIPDFIDPTPANYDFYMWSEVNDEWLNQKVGANNITSFVPGTGYLVAYQASGTRQFSGALNTDDVTATNLTATGGNTYSGWNLLGNPFASALNWNDGVNWTVSSDFGGVAKIWVESGAAYTDIDPGEAIPAMNGFMVQVLSGSPASLTIPSAARIHDATPWYKATEGRLMLIARDLQHNTAQECVIAAATEATEGYDRAYDSRFLAGYAPQFYSVAGAEQLSTNTLPSLDVNRVIDLGFVRNTAMEYSIGLDAESSLPGLTVYLTDKKTGVVTELTNGMQYQFTATEGDDANRFQLHFATLGIGDPVAVTPFSAYVSAGNIHIDSRLERNAEVAVMNLMGQVVAGGNAPAGARTVLNVTSLPAGVYTVRMTDGNSVYSRKIMIVQ